MPTSVSGKDTIVAFTQNVIFSTSFTFSVKEKLPHGRRNGCFSAENPGHIIIIYPAFTGFPVAHPSFFVFLFTFFLQEGEIAHDSSGSGMRYASFSDGLMPFHIRSLPTHPLGNDRTGIRPSIPGQLIQDTTTQT